VYLVNKETYSELLLMDFLSFSRRNDYNWHKGWTESKLQ